MKRLLAVSIMLSTFGCISQEIGKGNPPYRIEFAFCVKDKTTQAPIVNASVELVETDAPRAGLKYFGKTDENGELKFEFDVYTLYWRNFYLTKKPVPERYEFRVDAKGYLPELVRTVIEYPTPDKSGKTVNFPCLLSAGLACLSGQPSKTDETSELDPGLIVPPVDPGTK